MATQAMTGTETTAKPSGRKSIDCREYPSESNCSLRISGRPDEVLKAAHAHAVAVHGHADTPELDDQLRQVMKDTSD